MLLTQVYIYILPEHIWSKLSAKQLATRFRNPVPIVGPGRSRPPSSRRTATSSWSATPTYWGKQPTLDEVVFQYYTNTDTMVQDLKSGAVDGAQGSRATQFSRLESEPGIKPIAYPLYNSEYIE